MLRTNERTNWNGCTWCTLVYITMPTRVDVEGCLSRAFDGEGNLKSLHSIQTLISSFAFPTLLPLPCHPHTNSYQSVILRKITKLTPFSIWWHDNYDIFELEYNFDTFTIIVYHISIQCKYYICEWMDWNSNRMLLRYLCFILLESQANYLHRVRFVYYFIILIYMVVEFWNITLLWHVAVD